MDLFQQLAYNGVCWEEVHGSRQYWALLFSTNKKTQPLPIMSGNHAMALLLFISTLFFTFPNIVTKQAYIFVCTVECSTIITEITIVGCRYNALQYYKVLQQNYRNWSRISIRCWTHKRHLIRRTPDGESRCVFCEYLWETWPRYNSPAL